MFGYIRETLECNFGAGTPDHDFKIEVESRIFHVHKAILRSQSAYFSAMLSESSQMKEKTEGCAVIKDCKVDEMHTLLRIIYDPITWSLDDVHWFFRVSIDKSPGSDPSVYLTSDLASGTPSLSPQYVLSSVFKTIIVDIVSLHGIGGNEGVNAGKLYQIMNILCGVIVLSGIDNRNNRSDDFI